MSAAQWWAGVTRRLYAQRKLARLVVLAVAVFVLFTALNPQAFFNPVNAQTIALSLPEIALLGMATMIAMLTGGIDLSIVSTANLAALAVAGFFTATGTQDAHGLVGLAAAGGAVVLGLLVGLLAGAGNAALIAWVGVSPILATLGTNLLYNGLAISLTGGASLYGMPEAFVALGNESLGGIPLSFLLLLGVGAALVLVLRRTSLGTTMVLVGSGREAARYSGLSVRRTEVRTYLLTGLLGALAGIVIASRSASANPDYGTSYVLLAIVIAVLGGTNPDGGYGTVAGVILAALILQEVSSGMNLAGLSAFDYQVAQGAILVAVMVWDAVVRRPGAPPTEPPGRAAASGSRISIPTPKENSLL